MVSRDSAMNLRKLSCGIGAILVWSCTPNTEPSSPENGARGDERGAFKPLGALPRRSIRDPLARWSAQLESVSPPKVVEEPGFVQVQIPTLNGSSLNCFVYDMVLDSGQAVVRFLRAASVGLSFDGFQLLSVDEEEDAPVLFFSGAYTPQRSDELQGNLALMVSPRLQFPLVCSHDSAQPDPAFERIARDFSASFRASEPDRRRSVLSEVWRVEDSDGPLGFWFYRAYPSDDGSTTNLSILGLFRWQEGALHTSDVVGVEVEDKVGLLRGRWLHMSETEKRLEITLERSAVSAQDGSVASVYRYLGEQSRKRVRGEFQSEEPMHSSFFLHQQLEMLHRPGENHASTATLSWSQYIPEFSLNSETPVELESLEANHARLQRAGVISQLKLGPGGLPEEISGVQETPSDARLILIRRSQPARSTDTESVN